MGLIDATQTVELESIRYGRWIPCCERMPEKCGFYLAYFTFEDGTHAIDISYINNGQHPGCITHWMHLPEPPESRVKEGERNV